MSLISTQGLELALKDIIDQVQRQGLEISNLRSELSQCVTRSDIVALEHVFAERLTILEKRIETLEKETAVPVPIDKVGGLLGEVDFTSLPTNGDFTRIPVSQFILAQFNQINSLQTSLTNTATKMELDRARLELNTKLSDSAMQLDDSKASKLVLSNVQEVVEALQEQVSALHGVSATKLDRSEFMHVKSIATDLQTFSQFKQTAISDLRVLGTHAEDQRVAVDGALESIKKLSSSVSTLALSLQSKSDVSSVDELRSEVSRLDEHLRARAQASDLSALAARFESLSSRVASCEVVSREAQSARTQQQQALSTSLENIRRELAQDISLQNSALSAEMQRVQEELEHRAYTSTVEATDEALLELRKALQEAEKRLEVCLRFVEWYSDRGEAYEFNAGALERHMNQLAVGNRSRVAETAAGLRDRLFVDSQSRRAYETLDPAAMSQRFERPLGSTGPITGETNVRIGGIAQ